MGDMLVWLSPTPVPTDIRRRWQWPGGDRIGIRHHGPVDVASARHPDGRIVCLGRGHGRRGRRRFVSAEEMADRLALPLGRGELECFDAMLGPLACAVVADEGRHSTIWRDRFGRHPLQMVDCEEGWVVTSCPETAARLSDNNPRWSMIASFIHGTAPTTDADVFDDLVRIRPAERVRIVDFRIADRAVWWRPDHRSPPRRPTTELRANLQDIGRLYGTRPHTLALSSGLDSATLAAFATRTHPRSRAVTFAGPDPASDERRGAAETAAHLGISWRSFEIGSHWPLARTDDHHSPIAWGPAGHPDFAWKMPFHRRLDRRHSRFRPVVYGNGADEVLWVPPPIWFESRWCRADLRALVRAADHVPATRLARPAVRRIVDALGASAIRAVLPDRSRSTPPWMRPDRWTPPAPDPPADLRGLDPARRFFELRRRRLRTWRWERIVRTLAAERRRSGRPIWTPFLDAEFWELCLSMNPEHLVEGGRQKSLMRRVAGDLLPDDCVQRPKTGGFDAVVERGLADRASRRIIRLAARSRLEEAWPEFDAPAFLDAWQAYRRTPTGESEGTARGSWSIWKTVAAELWFRRCRPGRPATRTQSATEVQR